jgi:hypothetical protein
LQIVSAVLGALSSPTHFVGRDTPNYTSQVTRSWPSARVLCTHTVNSHYPYYQRSNNTAPSRSSEESGSLRRTKRPSHLLSRTLSKSFPFPLPTNAQFTYLDYLASALYHFVPHFRHPTLKRFIKCRNPQTFTSSLHHIYH